MQVGNDDDDEGPRVGGVDRGGDGVLSAVQNVVSGLSGLLGLRSPALTQRSRLLEFDPSSDLSEFDDEEEPPVVLVVGATGDTGRVVVRKLLLRGFQVRVLVRDLYSTTLEKLPTACSFVKGDVTDSVFELQDAVAGVDKIVWVLNPRGSDDPMVVEAGGVANMVQSFHNVRVQEFGPSQATKIALFRFSREGDIDRWQTPQKDVLGDGLASAGLVARPPRVSFFLNERKHAVLVGKIFDRYNGIAEAFVRPDRCNLRGFSGIILRVLGNGKNYHFAIQTAASEDKSLCYVASFATEKSRWTTVRLPFSSFELAPEKGPRRGFALPNRGERSAQLDRSAITQLGILFHKPIDRPEEDDGEFYLAVDYIKAYRTQTEPEFVLLSSADVAPGVSAPEEASQAQFVLAKRKAEDAVRNSGLTYCIIRAGALTNEEGGKRPLVLEQESARVDSSQVTAPVGVANKLAVAGANAAAESAPMVVTSSSSLSNTRTITRADVAELCVLSLLDPRACNLVFTAYEGNFAPTSMTPNSNVSMLFERLKPNTV